MASGFRPRTLYFVGMYIVLAGTLFAAILFGMSGAPVFTAS